MKDSVWNRKCIMICGAGGVGKTTLSAAVAVSLARSKKNVVVVTIDPAKRLAEALGFEISDLEASRVPLSVSQEFKDQMGIPAGHTLKVGLLEPKRVVEEIMEMTLSPETSKRLKDTKLYRHLSEMVYGLQEYTAYEWVTRLLQDPELDVLILDTPPATHAKDFFEAPSRIQRLMESRVFQLFKPSRLGDFAKKVGLSPILGVVEKVLGDRVFQESRVFFESFQELRDRILNRTQDLARFFEQGSVGLVAVTALEDQAIRELDGFIDFLEKKKLKLSAVLMNRVPAEEPPKALEVSALSENFADLPGVSEKISAYFDLKQQIYLESIDRLKQFKERHRDVFLVQCSRQVDVEGLELIRKTSDEFSKAVEVLNNRC